MRSTQCMVSPIKYPLDQLPTHPFDVLLTHALDLIAHLFKCMVWTDTDIDVQEQSSTATSTSTSSTNSNPTSNPATVISPKPPLDLATPLPSTPASSSLPVSLVAGGSPHGWFLYPTDSFLLGCYLLKVGPTHTHDGSHLPYLLNTHSNATCSLNTI